MSAARHVKAVTAGIAECVTEDHLPIRWNYGTRPAKYWHWRAIRRCNPFPSLSNNNYLLLPQLQTATATAGTELRLPTTTANCNSYFHPSSLEPIPTAGSSDSDRILAGSPSPFTDRPGGVRRRTYFTITLLDRTVAVHVSFAVLLCQHEEPYTPHLAMSNPATTDI
jgi:hypothetical protein